MTPITLEPISLLVAVGAGAVAAVLFLLRRLRLGVGALRDELRHARARSLVSDVLLNGDGDPLSAALPAVGLMADAVTALFPVSSPGVRSRLLVASPPDSTDPGLRSAAALLAAVSVSYAEVPEFGRAVRSGQPQRGVELGALLRRGATSLPFSTRERLFARVSPLPFVVVPIARPGGPVVGLLLAIGERDDLDRLAADLGRAATRLALLFPSPRKGPLRAHPAPRLRGREGVRATTPRDAELILWLDATGEVAACEPLQDDWLVDPPPRSLGDLFGSEATPALLQRAVAEGPSALGLARVGDETLAEVSLLRLADGERNTWGYAAFLRRVGPTAERAPTPSSRSASPRH